MGELESKENPVLKSRSQLSLTTTRRWGKRDHAWTAGDAACKRLILQFVEDGAFQGKVYILSRDVSPAHGAPRFVNSIATGQATKHDGLPYGSYMT